MKLIDLEYAYIKARHTAYRNAVGTELALRLQKLSDWYEYHYANILTDTLIKKWTRGKSTH